MAVAGAALRDHTPDRDHSLEAGRPDRDREAVGADFEAAADDWAEREDKIVVDENVAGYELGECLESHGPFVTLERGVVAVAAAVAGEHLRRHTWTRHNR